MRSMIKRVGRKIRHGYLKVTHVISATYKYFLHVCKNNDYDWDYSALLGLMAWKARKMADCIESNAFIEADKRIAKQLRYLDYLIQRYYNEEDRIMDEYYEKYGHPKHYTEKIEGSTNLRLKVDYGSREAEDEFLPYMDKSWKAREKIKTRIFRHMDRYIERWWD